MEERKQTGQIKSGQRVRVNAAQKGAKSANGVHAAITQKKNVSGERTKANQKQAESAQTGEKAQRVHMRLQKTASAQKTAGKLQRANAPADARALALDILVRILEEDAFSHLALREGLAAQPALTERDRAFVTRLVEGTIEYVLQLDALLDARASTKTAKMKPFIRTLLRMSCYQLLYLSRVPDAAVINEAVKLARKRGFSGLSGFVNAVLRGIAREKEAILSALADETKTKPHVRASMPEWLYQYFVSVYGAEETARICAWFLSDENGSYVRLKDGSSERRSGNIAASEAFRKGELTVQDYASQQVGHLAAPKAGSYVVDLCAAPGGKSCHVAELLAGTGVVDARDVSADKVRMIDENAARLKLTNVRTKVWDARVLDESLLCKRADGDEDGIADLVLADLPCSGLGIIGKKPDIKLHASMEQILSLQRLQREILKVAVRYVKAGGRLLYSTCTLTKEENEDNARWIAETLGLVLIDEKKLLPGQPSDGFYIAVFEKKRAD